MYKSIHAKVFLAIDSYLGYNNNACRWEVGDVKGYEIKMKVYIKLILFD